MDDFSKLITQDLIDYLKRFVKHWGIKEDDADDIVQTALTKALKKFSQFTPDSNFKAWTRRITKNTVTDWFKKHKEYQAFDDEVSSLQSHQEAFEDKETYLKFKAQIDSLDDFNRGLIELTLPDSDVTYEEIAILYGEKINTIKSLILRARKKLYNLAKSS